MKEPPLVRRDDVTRVAQYRSLWEYLRALGLQVTYPLRLIQSAAGAILTADDIAGTVIWGKTTGVAQSGATYPWIEQIRQADHTWIDGSRHSEPAGDGTSTITARPLYEVGGNLTVPVGTIVEIWQSAPSPDFLTQAQHC